MAQLRQGYPEFQAREAEVVVVGPEDAESFRRLWQSEGFPFVGLPDPSLNVLQRYGQEVSLLKLGRMPAQVVIDKQGNVRYAHYGHSMRDIPSNAELLQVLDQLNAPRGDRVQTET